MAPEKDDVLECLSENQTSHENASVALVQEATENQEVNQIY